MGVGADIYIEISAGEVKELQTLEGCKLCVANFITAARVTTHLTIEMEFDDNGTTQVLATVSKSAPTVYLGYWIAPGRHLYFAIKDGDSFDGTIAITGFYSKAETDSARVRASEDQLLLEGEKYSKSSLGKSVEQGKLKVMMGKQEQNKDGAMDEKITKKNVSKPLNGTSLLSKIQPVPEEDEDTHKKSPLSALLDESSISKLLSKIQPVPEEDEDTHKKSPLSAADINIILKNKGLKLVQIPGDGSCMYNAISHQLELKGIKYTATDLRTIASEYIGSHRDMFLPYVTCNRKKRTATKTFKKYVANILDQTRWGGQPELIALSEALRLQITIIQSEGDGHLFGENLENPTCITIVYKNNCHYDSVEDDTLDDDSSIP